MPRIERTLRNTFLLGFCTGALLLVMFVSPLVFAEQGGSNSISVDACQETADGVIVERFGETQMLPNGCRDAGHGERKYTLSCESGTSYNVTWTPCDVTVPADPNSDPQDNPPLTKVAEPSANTTNVQSPPLAPVSQEPSSQNTGDDGCGPHGYFHNNAALGDHCHCNTGYIEHPDELMCISAAEYVDLTTNPAPAESQNTSQQQPTPQPSNTNQTPSEPQDDGCGPHGWLHGSHCHCDNGYLEHPSDLICISTDEYVSLTAPSPDTQTNTNNEPPPNEPKSSQSENDSCGPNGWLHDDHCDCHAGYLQHPDELMCILFDEYILLFGSESDTSQDQNAADTNDANETSPQESSEIEEATDTCAPHGVLHNDHCDCHAGYIPDGLSCVPLAQFLENLENTNPEIVDAAPVVETPKVSESSISNPCAPHGVFHNDHCDCNPGYIGQGLSCVSLSSLLNLPNPQPNTPAQNADISRVQDIALHIPKTEDDADGCGPGGVLHNDHCDCEFGFLPIDLMCVPIESLLNTYTAQDGNQFTDASLIFEEYLAAYPEDIDTVILNWRIPEGPYDGFLIQASMDDVTTYAEVLPKRMYSYRYISQQSGLHAVSVSPYVLLKDGAPLLYEKNASTLVFLQAEAPKHMEAEILHDKEDKGPLERIADAFKNAIASLLGS